MVKVNNAHVMEWVISDGRRRQRFILTQSDIDFIMLSGARDYVDYNQDTFEDVYYGSDEDNIAQSDYHNHYIEGLDDDTYDDFDDYYDENDTDDLYEDLRNDYWDEEELDDIMDDDLDNYLHQKSRDIDADKEQETENIEQPVGNDSDRDRYYDEL